MSLRNIGIVYRKELTEALRDRRTLISSVLLPLLIFPMLSVGFISLAVRLSEKAKEEIPKVMILGAAEAPTVASGLQQLKTIEVIPLADDWKNQVVEKKVRAVVQIPTGFEKELGTEKQETVTVHKYDGELKSENATGLIREYLEKYRDSVVKDRLAARNIPEEAIKPFDVKEENVAPKNKSGAALFFGGFIAYIVVFLCLNGGMHPAMDLTAGEKERGTMETILSSPVSRTHLVFGKFLLVLTTALFTAALSVLSMGISFTVAHHFQDDPNKGLGFTIGPIAALSVFMMALPLSVLFASVLITISSFAKSYKEAQSYIMPLMFIVIIPAIAAMLPGVELNTKLALVPVLSVSLLCKELVIGTYHWNYIAVIFGSTCVYASIALFLAVKMFQRESVLFRS